MTITGHSGRNAPGKTVPLIRIKRVRLLDPAQSAASAGLIVDLKRILAWRIESLQERRPLPPAGPFR
jgi:hypothetical protein